MTVASPEIFNQYLNWLVTNAGIAPSDVDWLRKMYADNPASLPLEQMVTDSGGKFRPSGTAAAGLPPALTGLAPAAVPVVPVAPYPAAPAAPYASAPLNPATFSHALIGSDSAQNQLAQLQARPEALAAQEEGRPQDVFSRYLLEHGLRSLAEPTQDYLTRQVGDRYAQYILGRSLGQGSASNFSDYLNQNPNQGSPGMIRGQLQQLQQILGRTAATPQETTAQEYYRDLSREGIPQNLLHAALQPGLSEIAPSLRGLLTQATQRGARDLFAGNPETTIQGFTDWLRQRGLF